MKKFLIILLSFASLILGREDKNIVEEHLIYKDGLFFEVYDDGSWIIPLMKSCGYTVNGKHLLKYSWDISDDTLTVFRCDGNTLLFEGIVKSPREQSYGDPYLDLDGYCYDKSGMKRIKRVNDFTVCK